MLNARDMTLRREDEVIRLPPKAFETLRTLVEHCGEVVTKEQMMSRVWPDAYVEESNLTQNVFLLRRKLGLTPAGEEYIQTIPKRGYRITVLVEELADESNRAPASPDIAPVIEDKPKNRPRNSWLPPALIIAMVIVALVLWRTTSASPVAINYLELTHDGSDKRGRSMALGGPAATIVTDGSRIYFTEGSAQTLSTMQVSVVGGDTAPIVVPFGFPQILDFSSARSELLAGSFEDPASPAALWAIPVPAGVPYRLGPLVATDASWSPDGREIAFVKDMELYRALADGTNVRKLASLPGIGWRPRWSPDGKLLRLTVTDAKTASQSLWEVLSDGRGGLHPLLPGWSQPPGECCGAWSSDGRNFIFQATREGKTEAWVLASHGMTDWLFRPLRKPVQLTSGQMDSLIPIAGPDAHKVYVMGQHLRGELAKYDPRAHEFLSYLNGIAADMIDFSRDGQWIAYVAYPQGTLWRSRIDGADRRQLTFPPLYARVPQWSPDGRSIAYAAIGANEKSKIYIVQANGGTPEVMSDHGIEINPTFSSDGNSLVFSDAPFFSKMPAVAAIHTLDLRTRRRDTIPGSQGLFSPVPSPDGRYIAAMPLSGQRVMLFDSQTQSWSELTAGWSFLKWSNDGKRLYYRRYGDKPAILRIRLSDRKVEEVADLSRFRQGGRLAGLHFALAPDESPVLLRDTGTQEVYSLELGAR